MSDIRGWIFAGGFAQELTEGDVLCVFSQYGEIVEMTDKSRGFCFMKYEDPRSCELAVDNLNEATVVGRKLRVSYANNWNAIKAKKPVSVAEAEAAHQELKKHVSKNERTK